MAELVHVNVADRVATVSLNRPEKLNALSLELFDALREAGLRIEADPEVRAVLIRGEGRSFCSGLDIASLAGGEMGSSSLVALRHVIHRVQEGFAVWPRMSKPVIAAVHGYALGGGFQLALAADLRLCAKGAIMSVAEITYGLVPDLGGTHHLPRLIGPALAKELTWTGRRFTADEALAMRLVNRVVAPETLEQDARALARELAAKPPLAIGFGKRLLGDSQTLTLEDNFRRVAEAQAACILSSDFREAVAATFEKREGKFSGS